MIVVTLTPSEIVTAASIGVRRQAQNIARQRKPAYGAGNLLDWQYNVEGALGECALAKHLGLYWSGNMGELSLPDVGMFQVRTRSRHDYDLILHPRDPDDHYFWLLTGYNGSYRVHGYILGRDGKCPEYWRDPAGGRPAFFVPQTALITERTPVASR